MGTIKCKTMLVISVSLFLPFLVLVFESAKVFGATPATYYVDWDTGTDCLPPTCGVQSNPWKTPMYADDQLVSGDIVIVGARSTGGTDVYSNACATVLDAKTANTTWKAASGEVVWFSSTTDHSSNIWSTCGPGTGNNGYVAVHLSAANITFDGFYVWGMINLTATADSAIIQNCDLSGGGTYQGFPAVIRTSGNTASSSPPTDWNENLLVRNCKLHDNLAAMNQSGVNDILVLTYGAKNVIIENSEFYNALNIGIRWKDHPNNMTARYNYFHDMPAGVHGCGQYCTDGPIYVYHNVFNNVGNCIGVEAGSGIGPFEVRNNTFYNCSNDFYWWNAAGSGDRHFQSFNNIQYHGTTGQFYHWLESNWTAAYYVYLDYNQYFASGVATNWYINNANRSSTLSGWQTYLDAQGAGSTNGDDNAVSTNPNFLNGSVTFTAPADFKRSAYPVNGRGGAFPSVMGAYVTGNEIIGVRPGSLPIDTTPPNPPTGLKVN